ncbi:tyrosinase [Physcia stellaris]|nr:tyrosinase [Physcia stellaris]
MHNFIETAEDETTATANPTCSGMKTCLRNSGYLRESEDQVKWFSPEGNSVQVGVVTQFANFCWMLKTDLPQQVELLVLGGNDEAVELLPQFTQRQPKQSDATYEVAAHSHRYPGFGYGHRSKRHKVMLTSKEITKAAEEIDNMDVIATPLKIAKKTLPLRPTTQSDNENHDAETELVKTPANDTPLPRSPKSLISISSSSGSDNEQTKETLLNDDDGAAAIMKGPKYDATDVHESVANAYNTTACMQMGPGDSTWKEAATFVGWDPTHNGRNQLVVITGMASDIIRRAPSPSRMSRSLPTSENNTPKSYTDQSPSGV